MASKKRVKYVCCNSPSNATGNDVNNYHKTKNKNKKQVAELAGDPDTPGTCRNRQRWVPQAWKEAEQQAGDILQPSTLSSEGEREAAMFGVEERNGVLRGGGGGQGSKGEGADKGLVYDLLSVVVHRGSAYSGHYHAFIRDCLEEVSLEGGCGAY